MHDQADEDAIRARIRAQRVQDAAAAERHRLWLMGLAAEHAAQLRPDGSIGPTAETARQFRRSVVARLASQFLRRPGGAIVTDARGEPRMRLDRSQVQAADDIEQHYLAIGRGLWARASAYDVVSTHGQQISDPAGRMLERDTERMVDRYMPWARCEAEIRVGATTPVRIVADVVIDNLGCGQVGARHQLRHGRAYRVLFGSLARYCRIAGWAEPEPLPDPGALSEDQHGENDNLETDDGDGTPAPLSCAAARRPDREAGRIAAAYGGGIVRVG